MANEAAPKRKRGRPRLSRPTEPQTVQALERGLLVLEALARLGGATLSALSEQVGLPASTTHRLLATLHGHGMVGFDDSVQEWSVGVGAFRIGSAYLVRTNLVDGSRRTLRDLMAKTGETANLAILENAHIVYVSQVETQNPIRAFFRPGTRSQMHVSGIGKALMAAMARPDVEKILRATGLPGFTEKSLTTPEALFADLERSAARGWALDDEEHYAGMRCVAAPIYNAFGEAFAGLSVSGPLARFGDGDLAPIGEAVVEAAQTVTRLVGGRVPAAG